MSDTKTKEPLIRIIKRDRSSFGYKVWVRAAAIILALVVDAIFIYSVTGLNPLSVYGVMLKWYLYDKHPFFLGNARSGHPFVHRYRPCSGV